ncbi:hypothetical protein CP965_04070 [Halarcobacter mediterraneus]|uniref:TonB-dependent receptor n=1 Tax=Halarcobacter mediterraneus TaxID=2023153 RepID=A0A4Q1AXW6_9BACT|nr:TonB-dependent receptor [Halarcobacter mediterraneus]RXK14628.1 hypothetical protein CP965_04070 [Halarcobacter mediterraneus]
MPYNLNKYVIISLFLGANILFASQGKEDVKLDDITIQESVNKKNPETIDLENTLKEVPGGTNLIKMDDITSSKASISKVLNYEPGIIVQEFFGGNDQPRINIRGSGIQDNPVNRGIQILYDGLALNHPDGSFIIGMIDPEQADHLSIYRGSNAMRYGATTLGGAIDLNIRNAYNSSNSLAFEVGSFEFRKAKMTFAEKIGKFDYHLYASHSQQEGFRNHSEGKRDSIAFNLGYTEENWDNRTYFNYTKNDFDIPFLLRKEEAKNNPELVMGEGHGPLGELLNISIRKPKRESKEYRLANKTKVFTENSVQKIGFYTSKTEDTFRNPLTEMETDIRNFGLDYSFNYNHLLKNNLLTNYLLFVSANKGEMPRTYKSINPLDGSILRKIADVDLDASNVVLGGQVTQELTSDLKALASVQWVLNKREITDNKSKNLLDSDFSYSVLNPKVGLIYEPYEDLRLYTNFSTSSESPNFWQLATVVANPGNPLNDHVQINDLKMQKAKTFEVGVSTKYENFDFSTAFYYSEVDDELISVVGDFAVNGKTINYDGKTIHKGIELGVKHFIDSVFLENDKFVSKLIYNYSHFTFDDGEYEGKYLAGVPKHLIQAEFGYWPNSSWYLGANLRLQPEKTYIDHYNTESTKQDAYYLLGLETSYNITKNLRLFLDLNNITDEVYQTAYVVRGLSAPDLPNFIPGAGFNLTAGLVYKW